MNAIEWLLDSDPAIRWQVMRDLTDAPAEDVAAERAKVAKEGWGARLLALQPPDGVWGGGEEIAWGEVHVGTRSMFAGPDFAEVSHPTPRRVVMRIDFPDASISQGSA